MKEVRKCEICGKPFVANNVIVVCCSDECRRKRRNILDAEYRKKYKSVGIEKKKKKKPTKSIAEIAVEARKAGMTYGQYVAQMGL